MAMNVTPFKSTDEFTMAGFNGKLADINSGVNDEVASALSGLAHIETGSYDGTGTYGYKNLNSLTFGFAPKLVIITGGSYGGVAVIPYDGQDAPVHFNTSSSTWSVTRSGNTISWYDQGNQSSNGSTGTTSAYTQMNESGQTYYYIAIG